MAENKNFVEGLCSILVKNKAVTQKESESLKKNFFNRSKDSFDFFLLDEGLVTKKELLQALSEYFKVPSFDVRGYLFDHDLVKSFPKEFLLEFAVIPLEVDQDILTVVASRPDEPRLLEEIENYTSYVVEFLVGEKQPIIDAIREYFDEPPGGYIHDTTDEDELEESEVEAGEIDLDDFEDKKRW